ncbi:MAG: 4'-phosphopantetheinyl transferase superfamily protein [Arenimonas sp.]|nr:4'-phosphopantetheinyl transferase superfamily protein [Arenimonas sp.]
MLIDLNQSALQAYFGAVCIAPIFVWHQNQQGTLEEFNFNEMEKLSEFNSEKRKRDYVLGRIALKKALESIGYSTDTSIISWPSPFCSLSHSDGHAIAVSSVACAGIGIDLQLNKTPPFEMADRILSGQTLQYWHQLSDPEKAKYLQRFWTANEAIYKACPAPQPAYFRHYRLETPESLQSDAYIDNTDFHFKVYSAELSNGFVSLAVRL